MSEQPDHEVEPVEADQEELRLALHAARVGAWTLDLRTGEMRTAGTYGQLLCGPGTADDFAFATFADFLRAVHPDDRAAVASSATGLASDHTGTGQPGTPAGPSDPRRPR